MSRSFNIAKLLVQPDIFQLLPTYFETKKILLQRYAYDADWSQTIETGRVCVWVCVHACVCMCAILKVKMTLEAKYLSQVPPETISSHVIWVSLTSLKASTSGMEMRTTTFTAASAHNASLGSNWLVIHYKCIKCKWNTWDDVYITNLYYCLC